jgi:hypothetical protein
MTNLRKTRVFGSTALPFEEWIRVSVFYYDGEEHFHLPDGSVVNEHDANVIVNDMLQEKVAKLNGPLG